MNNEVDTQSHEPSIDGMEDDQAISFLSSLSDMEYERQREQAAKNLNVRTSQLDKMVKEARKSSLANQNEFFPVIEPFGEPVNGEELLNRIEAACTKFVICDQSTRTAVTLWIVLTWLVDDVDCLPIANITAPEKNCGKSTLLSFIGKLAYQTLTTSNITSSALFRAIEKWSPTLLIDEADSFTDDDEAIRGIINAGHTRDSAYVIRCIGDNHEPRQFSVWGAKAIAGIGKRAGTIESRSIELRLRRKMPNESISRMKTGKPEFAAIQTRLARWTQDNSEIIRKAEPELPKALQNRDADNWEPLLAIADCAGGRWPKLARNAALETIKPDENMSVAQELLSDIKTVFESKRVDRLFTADLLEALINIEDAPWSTYNRGKEFTPRQLAKQLSGYDIKSTSMRIGVGNKKGYLFSGFTEAFNRYLEPPKLSVTTSQLNNGEALRDISNVTTTDTVTDKKTLQATKNKGCDGVTDKNQGKEQEHNWQEAI